MKSRYFENLEKIEFVVTYACTGRCKHCSEGDHVACGEFIDPKIAADAVRKVVSEYGIKTVMAFGGEPLLYPDAVFEIMSAASGLGVPKRQVITNGFFEKSPARIAEVAKMLKNCGVNDLLLSVDAFHQETVPLDTVKNFAREIKKAGIPVRLQPAWLKSKDHDNPYNRKTREILDSFCDMGIYENEGNIVFPEGNAKKYLAEYFTDGIPENPYAQDPENITCLSVSPNGDLLDSNICSQDVMDIIRDYIPYTK